MKIKFVLGFWFLFFGTVSAHSSLLILTKPNPGRVVQNEISRCNAWVEKSWPEIRVQVIRSNSQNESAIQCIKKLSLTRLKDTILEVEIPKDFVLMDRIPAPAPNDPLFSMQTSLKQFGAPVAWRTSTGSSSVLVGVIDSGVDYRHEDLAANMWINSAEVPDNNIDDDHNGYTDDVYGIDTLSGFGPPMDSEGHGTHVAGILGARGNNRVGIAGVSWNSKILPIRAVSKFGGNTESVLEAIRYAILNQVQVINASFGGYSHSKILESVIRQATQEHNIVFVAAAGNDGLNTDEKPFYPASYRMDGLISVGASNLQTEPASFSNFGSKSVDVFATGVSLFSTLPHNQYDVKSGSSMAAPMVAGAAALILAQNPGITALEVANRLKNSVSKKASFKGKSVSNGVLDIRWIF